MYTHMHTPRHLYRNTIHHTSTFNIHTKGGSEHMLMAFFIRASGALYSVAEPMRPHTLTGNAEIRSMLSTNAVVE